MYFYIYLLSKVTLITDSGDHDGGWGMREADDDITETCFDVTPATQYQSQTSKVLLFFSTPTLGHSEGDIFSTLECFLPYAQKFNNKTTFTAVAVEGDGKCHLRSGDTVWVSLGTASVHLGSRVCFGNLRLFVISPEKESPSLSSVRQNKQ